MPYISDCGGEGSGSGSGGDPTVGSTTMFVGSVDDDAGGDYIPAVAGNIVTEFSIRCTVDQPLDTRLEFSLDDGATWFRLKVGEAYADSPKNLFRLKIRAAGSGITTADFEILLNRGII